jgi:hypothetical protein
MQDIASASQLRPRTPCNACSHTKCGKLSKKHARNSRTMDTNSTLSPAKQLAGRLVYRKQPHASPRLTINDSKMKLFCDTMTFDRARGEQDARSLGLHLPDDYLYWVLVFRRDAVEDEENEQGRNPLTPEQSAEKSQRITAHWHPRIRSILSEQDPSAASSLMFLAANPQDLMTTWSEEPSEHHASVTLLGDAAHPMPPVGGFGASSAFQDAAALCDALAHSNDAEAQIRSYEREMCARAQSVVHRSIEGSGRFFGMRPIEELKLASSACK